MEIFYVGLEEWTNFFFKYKKNDIGKRMKKQELESFHKFMLFTSLIDFSSLKLYSK